MKPYSLLLLAGDGIGPEVMEPVKKLIAFLNASHKLNLSYEEGLIGGCAYDAYGTPLAEEELRKAASADAVLLGAVGGPQWADVPYALRPEAGLLNLFQKLELFADLRIAKPYRALASLSPLKQEHLKDMDILIVRELAGGIYMRLPKEIIDLGNGQKRAIDTQTYETYEIERIARIAFETARTRKGKVTSIEKRNLMKTGLLWYETVTALHQSTYSDVALEHLLADAACMELVKKPSHFDVILTDNLFGDLLSDLTAGLMGSVGICPCVSMGAPDPITHKRIAVYEPIHGSAPDIAGQGIANPIAMLSSFALCLRYSLNQPALADTLEQAIALSLKEGARTRDLLSEEEKHSSKALSTDAMGAVILESFTRLLDASTHDKNY